MKKSVKIAVLFAVACLVTACYNDKGNYDYVALNEISVDTVGVQTTYTCEQYDSIHIVPVLQFSNGEIPESRLAYKWVLYIDNFSASEAEMELLSTEKELHMQVTQQSRTENYAIIYYVTNLDDNTVWQQKYTLIVQPSIVSGIVALHTLNGETDFDYIATTNSVPGVVENKWLRNMLYATNGRGLSGNPVSISTVRQSGQSGSSLNYVYVATDEEMVQLSGKDFSMICDVNELFYQRPEVLKPYRVMRDGQIAHTTVMINGDQVHNINNQSSQYWNNTFSDALRTESSLGEVSVAPFIYMPDSYNTGNIAVFYDTKGKRFVRLPYSFVESAKLAPFVSQVSTAFDVNNIGKDLIWFGIGYNAHGFALMTDYTLYRANFNTDEIIYNPDGSSEVNEGINDLAVRIYDLSGEPEIQNAKFFDCGEFATLFMYATERDIYVTSIRGTTLQTKKINNDFPADEKITALMIYNQNVNQMSELSSVTGNYLYVATWNGTEGKIYEFAIARNTCEMNNTQGEDKKAPLNVFEGMGKVVDMAVKVQGWGDDTL